MKVIYRYKETLVCDVVFEVNSPEEAEELEQSLNDGSFDTSDLVNGNLLEGGEPCPYARVDEMDCVDCGWEKLPTAPTKE